MSQLTLLSPLLFLEHGDAVVTVLTRSNLKEGSLAHTSKVQPCMVRKYYNRSIHGQEETDGCWRLGHLLLSLWHACCCSHSGQNLPFHLTPSSNSFTSTDAQRFACVMLSGMLQQGL